MRDSGMLGRYSHGVWWYLFERISAFVGLGSFAFLRKHADRGRPSLPILTESMTYVSQLCFFVRLDSSSTSCPG